MKLLRLSVLTAVFAFSCAFAQTYVFDTLDQHPDSAYAANYVSVSETSWVSLSVEEGIVQSGDAALRYEYQVERNQDWGGFAKYEMWHPDSFQVFNFAAFENLGIWYYNETASTDPGRLHLRIQMYDVSDAPVNTYDANNTELWYSFEYVLDDAQGWNQILLPLEDIGAEALDGSNGFWRTGWAGVTGNDALDLDAIKGIGFEISIDGPQTFEVHNGTLIFDHITFEGAREIPLIFFNGNVIPGNINNHFAWNGSSEIAKGAGQTENTNALQWNQDPGQAWTGMVWEFDPQFMNFRWSLDSLKFWIKAPTGTGTLRVQFGDAAGNLVKELIDEPGGGYGDEWTLVSVPLQNINDFEAGSEFDTTSVNKFELMAEGSGNGYTILFDDMWTGKPEIDVVAPAPPTSLFVFPDNLSNLITWLDSPGEDGETYNVYHSLQPITDLTSNTVNVVEQGLGVAENTGSITHLLFSPLGDSLLSTYYAVTAVDAAGNESDPVLLSTPVENTARGIATISLDVPMSFSADGSLNEWSSIEPFVLLPSQGAHIVPNTVVSGDNDLSTATYLAVDETYLYFAFDMTDDVVDTTASNSWEKDSPDLFLGLYNHYGAPHQAYGRGAQPDYQLRFLPSRVIAGNLGDVAMVEAGDDYSWTENFPFGYIIEGRIALATLAAAGGDDLFVAQNGYRIPFDMSINDADGGGVREGIMTWSPYNNDTAWQTPADWLYTWAGTDITTGIEDGNTAIVYTYELKPNYPNPFNPSTTIVYSLAKASDVRVDIYNTLGQKVSTLVNNRQGAGEYRLQFNASALPSGVYFYRIEAGAFAQTRKMMLLK